MKKSRFFWGLIIVLFLAIEVSWAQSPTPESPSLPFWWVTGKIRNPDKLNGRPVVVFSKSYNFSEAITSEVAADGSYRVNVYELYYYHPKNFSEEALCIGVIRDANNNWGTIESFKFDYREGFKEINLNLVENGGPNFGSCAILGEVSNERGTKVFDADLYLDGNLSATSDAQGEYSINDVAPGIHTVECLADGYEPAQATVTLSTNEVAQVNFRLTLRVPSGSVPLDIFLAGNNIHITWEASKYQKPQIFALFGDGTGSYQKNYDPAKWIKIAEGGGLVSGVSGFSYSEGLLTHEGQVRGGSYEVYYKGVLAEVNLSDVSGRSTFEAAWAVGKINVTIESKGIKLLGIPLYAGKVSEIFKQLKDDEEVILLPRSGGGLDYVTVTKSKVTGQDFKVEPTIGFWMKNGLNNVLRVTFAGKLPNFSFRRELASLDLTGNPLATSFESRELGGENGDIILPQSGLGLDYYVKTNDSWGNFKNVNFTAGFWYKYSENKRRWNIDPLVPKATIEQF